MKIGFLSVFNYGSNIGGVENHIYFMAKELKRLGHEIVIFQPASAESNKIETNYIEGVRVVLIPIGAPKIITSISTFNGAGSLGMLTAFLNKAKYFFSRKKIAEVIAEENIDLLHQHDFISNIFTTKILARRGMKCVLTNHTGEYLFFYKSSLGRLALRYLLSHYSYVIGPSKELTPEFVKRSITIHNGVDHSAFFQMSSNEVSVARKKYGLEDDDYVILCPRRWAPTKGVIYLIKSIIENDYPGNYKFLFAGSDYDGFVKYKESINSIVEGSNKKSSIMRLGNIAISEMNALYNISDLVVIPSLMEAVSLSAVEAMATGKPVVSTDVGGMPELIKTNINGLLIPPKAPTAIFDAIMELASKELYDAIKAGAIATASEYSWQSKAVKTEAIYKEVLGSVRKVLNRV